MSNGPTRAKKRSPSTGSTVGEVNALVDRRTNSEDVAKLEGDAAFAYADRDGLGPSMLLDTVESAHFAFQMRLRDIVHSTTCQCNACIRIPALDLEFFVHDGEYVVKRIARSEELTGSDVIVVHRLAKDSSGAVIGKPAYAVYTKMALEALGLDPAILGFTAHTETFPDIDDVEVYILEETLGVQPCPRSEKSLG